MNSTSSKGSIRQFLSGLGFDDNPFQFANADKEDRLPSYFVPPPYFAAVFGDPSFPKSHVVFAPRGGGKSAQRRMIESRCVEEGVLAITYDQFEFPDLKHAGDVSLYHHLRRLLRFTIIALLVNMKAIPETEQRLTKGDKQIFVKLAAEHLAGIKESELEVALNALKSFKDKFKDFWNEWLPAIGPGLKSLVSLLKPVVNLGEVGDLKQYQEAEFATAQSLKYQLRLVVDLAKKLGWKSVYILVDRVDESSLTGNDAQKSFALLEPLLRDLELLEFPGICFKFFLWDMLQPLCEDVIRTDRIDQETLYWDQDLLHRLLSRRLKAFSQDLIASLTEISVEIEPHSIDELTFIFASHSPRDLIRIGSQYLTEQQQLNQRNTKLSKTAVYEAINKFCSRRASEIVNKERVLRELRKVRQVDFTIPEIANEVFREKQTSTRSRMMVWRQEAAIIEIERINDPNSKQTRPVKLFAIQDVRVARELFPEMSVPEFLEAKYKKCPNCDSTVLRDWGEVNSSGTCLHCQYDLLSKSPDDWETWRRKALAAESRKRYRTDIVHPQATQIPMSFGAVEENDSED